MKQIFDISFSIVGECGERTVNVTDQESGELLLTGDLQYFVSHTLTPIDGVKHPNLKITIGIHQKTNLTREVVSALNEVEIARQNVQKVIDKDVRPFSPHEIAELAKCPAALQWLVDYHDNQIAQAEAMDCVDWACNNEKRKQELEDARVHFQKLLD